MDATDWDTPTMPIMNCIIWNTRWANNIDFRRHCKAMIEIHKPTILALLETRMWDHNSLAEDLGYSKKSQYPAVRRSGGLSSYGMKTISASAISIYPLKAFMSLSRFVILLLIGTSVDLC